MLALDRWTLVAYVMIWCSLGGLVDEELKMSIMMLMVDSLVRSAASESGMLNLQLREWLWIWPCSQDIDTVT